MELETGIKEETKIGERDGERERAVRPRAKHEARAVPFRGESRRGITTKSSVQRERPIGLPGVGALRKVSSGNLRELRLVFIKLGCERTQGKEGFTPIFL